MGRGVIVRVLCLAATIGLVGCNPYHDELPQPRCRTQRDCRPGDHCRAGACEAVRSLVVIAAPRERPLHGWVLATRDDALDPLTHPSARFVTALSLAPDEPTARVDALPELCLWLVAWVGDESPVADDPSDVLRVPDMTNGRVVLAPSRPLGSAPRRPPPLGWSDRAFLLGG